MTIYTKAKVREALIKNGYKMDANEILSAQFVKMNATGSEVHRISWMGDDGIEFGYVYIDKDGKGDY